MSEVVLVEVVDRVATITLNRPEARNALNADLRRALPQAVAECDASDDIDVLVLTGADPVFCAGLDLKELGQSSNEADDAAVVASTERRGPLPPTVKPLIGAINGAAITGGFELALNCDFLIASEHARFADTHTRVGIQPGWGLTVLLAEAVGVRRAKELSSTGNFLDAQTALTWGLVNHVVPHGEPTSCRTIRTAYNTSSTPTTRATSPRGTTGGTSRSAGRASGCSRVAPSAPQSRGGARRSWLAAASRCTDCA